MSNSNSRVLIKNRRPTKSANTTKRGVYYMGIDSKDITQENMRQWFGPDQDLIKEPKEFIDRVKSHRALKHSSSVKSHHMIFSMRKADYEAYKRSGRDYKHIIREVIGEHEKKHGLKLDWIAHIHEGTKSNHHPHCHVVIKAISDNLGDRGFKRVYFSNADTNAMRSTFDHELERHAEYKFMEREDVRQISDDLGKAFDSALQGLAQEAERRKREADMERSKQPKNRGKERGR